MRIYPKFCQVEQAMIPHRGKPLSTREIAGLAGVCVSTCRVALWSMAANPEIPLRKMPEKSGDGETMWVYGTQEAVQGLLGLPLQPLPIDQLLASMRARQAEKRGRK